MIDYVAKTEKSTKDLREYEKKWKFKMYLEEKYNGQKNFW